MKANGNGHLVRPLGRYGEWYHLNDRLYRIYRLHTTISWVLTILTGMSGMILPNVNYSRYNWISWPFLSFSLIFGVLSVSGQFYIAKQGTSVVVGDELSRKPTSVRIFYLIFALVSAVFFIVITTIYIIKKYESHQSIGTIPALLLIYALYVVYLSVRRLLSSK